ncbi:hypothetical protein FGM00_05290 [Aggregatimonas sangjinii]|uniref:Uncharacterized protein n=1 Tax=Aggregatimonas sangjinii TaxID=2583587 RepID=A0A5B7SRM9_9FLAO|nr:hypothetical protein [Aggregatimonas sangjinii]QCW99549.1 hypothetical protein FGM00_05290 [Aggregatimonas sangjinii]
MKRRSFVQLSAAASIALGFPLYGCSSKTKNKSQVLTAYEKQVAALLKEWCDGMIAVQTNKPDDLKVHGALHCPACDKIHGRCMDAVYPFLYMADVTGERKYMDAAINVMKWSENVSMPDGSWTVIPDPKSWKGITVFGAIALGEALHHHGHVLTAEIKEKWTQRLKRAAEFIHKNFTIDYSHINYAFTAVYALNFLGRFFENEAYISHSKTLAKKVPNWLTSPNKLLFGENKPADVPSAKGLLPVDLGYNVEETLNGLVQYAILEKDEELLQLLTKSLEGHLEFMLPDGAWDNSWGTRQNKWSYWGSRTTDGCQPAFALMANRNAAFGTAAIKNTELLQRCTVNGLLAGGLHYESHGVKPCVHHTFAHAKSLAFILDNTASLPELSKEKPLPRSIADGVKHFQELDVWLAARGDWKATISSYDVVFKKKYSQAATGGALAVLWHNRVGPIFTASMAEYVLAEVNNQQPQADGEDIPLTPRIEVSKEQQWFSNLFDLKAQVAFADDGETIQFEVTTNLTDREGERLPQGEYVLQYDFSKDKTIVKANLRSNTSVLQEASLLLPVISPTGEKITQPAENRIEIQKESALVVVEANVPISIKETKKERVFNMVPGMEAVPIQAFFTKGITEIVCQIKVV